MSASHMRPRTDRRSRRGAVARTALSLALFALGAALFFYPLVTAWMGQQQVDERLAASLGSTQASAESDGLSSGAAAQKRDKATDPAYQYLLAYNQRVAAGTAGAINDPWGIGSDQSELDQAGLTDGIVGSLTVPAMGVHLPIYLGASAEHMANGAALVAGTSAPLGDAGDTTGTGSNCVIAGHRGVWRGVPIFRDIEDIKLGDTLTIDTPWDTLTYRAVEIRVVDPDDVDAVAVQPGRDLVTLLTCHPYGHNSKRYLVFFERAADAGAAGDAAVGDADADAGTSGAASLFARNPVAEALKPSDSPQLTAERWLRVAGLGIMAVMAVSLLGRVIRALLRR